MLFSSNGFEMAFLWLSDVPQHQSSTIKIHQSPTAVWKTFFRRVHKICTQHWFLKHFLPRQKVSDRRNGVICFLTAPRLPQVSEIDFPNSVYALCEWAKTNGCTPKKSPSFSQCLTNVASYRNVFICKWEFINCHLRQCFVVCHRHTLTSLLYVLRLIYNVLVGRGDRPLGLTILRSDILKCDLYS